jgi:choline dehydrogenase-like flavoprotein
MPNERYDVVIIGSGAGGGTMAHALADTPARVLVLERGDFVPQEAENWSPEAVWKHLRYQTGERWLDDQGQEFRPYTHYNIGGNTKFWGAVLYRLRREDFEALEHMDGVSPAWPIDYDALEPYYERAERLYDVHGEAGTDPTEPRRGAFPHPPVPHAELMAAIVAQLRSFGLHPSPLPLGLRDGCILCDTCNSFPCKLHAKSDADVCCVRPALERPNVELWANTFAKRLITNADGTRVEAVDVERNGTTIRVESSLVVVSCGAVNSAALLLRSASDRHPNGLGNSSGLVGRRYMAHLATMMQGFHPFRKNPTVFQKTVAINDFYLRGPHTRYPLGQIQSQGRTHGVMAQTVVPQVPLSMYEWWVARGVDWLAMSEDLPDARNRILVDASGRIQMIYRPQQLTGPSHARERDQAHSAPARLLGCDDAFTWQQEHHPPVRHGRVRHRPPRVGPRHLLPLARRREPVCGRRVVLPLLRGRQPGPDDRRAGIARRRPHPDRRSEARPAKNVNPFRRPRRRAVRNT